MKGYDEDSQFLLHPQMVFRGWARDTGRFMRVILSRTIPVISEVVPDKGEELSVDGLDMSMDRIRYVHLNSDRPLEIHVICEWVADNQSTVSLRQWILYQSVLVQSKGPWCAEYEGINDLEAPHPV